MISKLIFWTSVFFVGYAYLGYPLALFAISLIRTRKPCKADIVPSVSFIIAAYNEEERIQEKVENTLKQFYPRAFFEIIVASDCSTDRTDKIVQSYESHGVRLVRAPDRKGKENAQKHAIQVATGEILVFSDVATILRRDGVSQIVKNFHDPSVGCVSSIDEFINNDGKINGEGAYVKYEMLLRGFESKVNTLVGLSGSFFAARKEVCQDWIADLPSDFTTLLNSVKLGLRGVLDRDSIGYYHNLSDEKKEYYRKVRTVLRGISGFKKNLFLLNPWRYGLFSWQLFSHKLCRWLVPFALAMLFCSNVVLAEQSMYYIAALIVQVVFYASAFTGLRIKGVSHLSMFKIPAFFVLVNLSILNAWYRYIKGERFAAWEPTKRQIAAG